MALRKSALLTALGMAEASMRLTRSLVTVPALRVSKQASSRASAYFTRSLRPSSSPRLRRAPLQAKMVAMGFVEVSSPFRYL